MQKSEKMIGVIKKWTLPLLSFVWPGLSHLCLGYQKKGISLVIVFGVVFLTFFTTQQWVIKILMVVAYVALSVPSAIEIGLELHVGKHDVLGRSKVYLSVLLLMTGLAALPLLWQGDAYRLSGKILWTITVIILAIAFFLFLGHFMSYIEAIFRKAG